MQQVAVIRPPFYAAINSFRDGKQFLRDSKTGPRTVPLGNKIKTTILDQHRARIVHSCSPCRATPTCRSGIASDAKPRSRM